EHGEHLGGRDAHLAGHAGYGALAEEVARVDEGHVGRLVAAVAPGDADGYCGAAGDDESASTAYGGSSVEKVTSTGSGYAPTGRLRFVNAAPDSEEFGMIWMPEPVSTCTARQLTCTTRPRVPPTSSQSPILNGCSN